jgi:hypothetical protein
MLWLRALVFIVTLFLGAASAESLVVDCSDSGNGSWETAACERKFAEQRQKRDNVFFPLLLLRRRSTTCSLNLSVLFSNNLLGCASLSACQWTIGIESFDLSALDYGAFSRIEDIFVS